MKLPRALALLPLLLSSLAYACGGSAPDLHDRAWSSLHSAKAVVHFEPGSSDLSLSAMQTLHALAVDARMRPDTGDYGIVVYFKATGHADASGEDGRSADELDFLASDRAIAAGAFLDAEIGQQRGIDDQISFAESESDASPSLGCESDSDHAASDDCMAANRRVEIEVYYALRPWRFWNYANMAP